MLHRVFKTAHLVLLSITLFSEALPHAIAEDSPRIPELGVIGPVTRVHTGFQFTEGPASDKDGLLYFSDVAGNKILRLDSDQKLTVFLEPSFHANGLFFDPKGDLIVAQMDGRVARVNISTKEVTPLVETYGGKRFNAPNDLVVDHEGGIYFTDPRFRAPEPWPQGKEAVYYLAPEQKVQRLIDDIDAPNGILLSLDEKVLYVIPTLQKEILAYDVRRPGELRNRRVFASLKQSSDATNARPGGDGLTQDSKGNLYIATAIGVQIFDASGKYLGVLTFPEQPSNATFGGPQYKTLFVTARTSLYAVQLEVAGQPPFAAVKP